VGGLNNVKVLDTLPSPAEYGYRNHARFTVGRAGDLGFVNRETRRFVRIDRCMLMHDGINHILNKLQDRCGETTQLAVRAGRDTGDFLVQPPLKNPEVAIATGQKHYLESVGSRQFRVASPSFFQVNIDQTSRLIEVVREAVNLSGTEVLLDAYTGVGTFAVLLAPFVRQVYAVEESSAAVADARENAAGIENVAFLLGKTEEVLADLPQRPDVVILDPPRAGCQPSALEKLLSLRAPRLVYVSCDPETLGRDLKVLCAQRYAVARIQPLDMFPQTHHVECVAVLTLKQTLPPLVLASGSPRRRELLTELGLDFVVQPSNAPEEQQDGESAEDMVRRLSRDKALTVAAGLTEGYVIGADSTVVLAGQSIGKPEDEDDARRMLRELRGTEHQVTTGLTVMNVATGQRLTDHMTAEVVMREFTDAEMETSIASGTPMDKAGAYAVQDEEFRPATLKDGCFTNVVGLPLCRLLEMLTELGYEPPANLATSVGGRCLGYCPIRDGSKVAA
jgi:23S rRNA (uracil1939-C5)-methyltransferase